MTGLPPARDFALRTMPAFSICSTLAYFLFMGFGISPFIYYPEAGRFTTIAQSNLGPPMFWYGWLLYSGGVGCLAGAGTWLLPRRVAETLAGRLSWLLWSIPSLVCLIILYLLRHYFLVSGVP
jgi:hypothetical protein